MGNDSRNLAEILKNICLAGINTTAILLGQVNVDNLKIFNQRAFGVPILLVWLLCGRYIIMDNLYTGSIFSYMSALKSPRYPETLKELVDLVICYLFLC